MAAPYCAALISSCCTRLRIAEHGCAFVTGLYVLVCVGLYTLLIYIEIEQAWFDQLALPCLIPTETLGSSEPHP